MSRTITRRTFGALAGAAVALSTLGAPAFAEPTELIFNVFIPRPAPLYKNALEPWARAAEEASNGTLKITIPAASMAPPPKQYDLVLDGVADISVAPLTFRRKQMGLDMIGYLPLIGETAKGASVAAWETHQKFFADKNQWGDLVLLSMFTLGSPAILSNTSAITSQDDLSGFKVLAVGKEKVNTWKNLGAVPVGSSGAKPFEAISSGVADGTTSPLGTAAVQGLLKATKHVTLVPGGMGGRATFGVFSSRDRFEALPEEAQKARMQTAGAGLAAKIGTIMDKIDASGLKKFQDAGIEIGEATPEFVAAIEEAGAFITDAWEDAANGMGVDADAALAYFKEVAAAQ